MRIVNNSDCPLSEVGKIHNLVSRDYHKLIITLLKHNKFSEESLKWWVEANNPIPWCRNDVKYIKIFKKYLKNDRDL